ncbi:MAG: cytochrome c biogenesis protein CcsA [Phycisphaerales bacterium]
MLFRKAFVAMMLVFVAALPALGEQGPAGNTHPQSMMLSQAGAVNPFGEPERKEADTAAKFAFSKAVDLTPLRDLAVFHNGRVKILDSLARETVAGVTGRKDFLDFRPGAGGKGVERLRYDPLFTFLDMVIDPSYYEAKPLVGVNYLPLRDAFLERAFPGTANDAERENWKKMGRISPRHISGLYQSVAGVSMTDAYQKALGSVHEGMMLYALGAQNFLLVPAETLDAPWNHLSTLPAGSPGAAAVKALGEGWRAMDAAKVNAAARELALVLPTINPSVYPTTKRTLERAYNAAKPFEWGSWLYAFALVSLLLSFGTGRRGLLWLGAAFLAAAVSMHAFGFVTRCIIAERFAIQNQFESLTGVSLFAAAIGLSLAVVKRQAIFGAAVAAVGFLVLITATQTSIPGYSIEREAAILNTSVLLKYHVTTVLFSYGLISLGFIVSLFYLGTHYLGGKGTEARSGTKAQRHEGTEAQSKASAPGRRSSALPDLDSAQMTILHLAFWTLGVGILLGAWWADHSWGRWWAFDPKELWALLTWLVYLVVVHLRHASVRDKALTTAWFSVLGFFTMLWCYFGVNLLLPGLHAYA